MIVQLPRKILALFLLCRDQALRQLAHLALRVLGDGSLFLRSALERTEPVDGNQGNADPEQQVCHEQPEQVGAKRRVPLRDLGALRARFALFSSSISCAMPRIASRRGTTSFRRNAGAAVNLFGGGPVEERLERSPVVVELSLAGCRICAACAASS